MPEVGGPTWHFPFVCPCLLRMGTWNGLGCWEPGALITIREDGKLNMLAVINGTSESKFFLGEFVTKVSPSQNVSAKKYSDLTRVFTPNGGDCKGNPLISGKSRLVKFHILAKMFCKHTRFRNYTTY